MASLLNLKASDIDLDPFPHAVSDQIIDPILFSKLLNEFPNEADFLETQKQPYGSGRSARINLMRHDKNFKKLELESKSWGDFISQLVSREFVSEIVELFAYQMDVYGNTLDRENWKYSQVDAHPPESFRERLFSKFKIQKGLDCLLSALDKNVLNVSVDIAWARQGYSTEIHTDNRNKLAAFIIYFNETDGKGGDFQIHAPKDQSIRIGNSRYPREEEVTVVKTLAPKANKGAIFLNCPSAYHSVLPLTDNTKFRKFLYVSIGSPYSVPIWQDDL